MEQSSIQARNEQASKRAAWFKLIEDFNSSGLSQVDYCRQHTINKDHFAYYLSRWRLKTTDVNKSTAFVELQITESADNKWILKIASGVSLEIPQNIPMHQLAELVLSLRAKSC
jgi:hypothetical protein